jgi:GNAT superfamily N-acetyltransferase
VTEAIRVRRVQGPSETDLAGLTDVLIDCVEGGASVSFMLPLTESKARVFWRETLESCARGERALWVAEERGAMLGTVQLVLDLPENQPHRGEIAKMLVTRAARRRGVGAALLVAAEEHARRIGRTLLVLDTANVDAERLYEAHGWQRCGRIPGYALMPDGQPCATTIYFKSLG